MLDIVPLSHGEGAEEREHAGQETEETEAGRQLLDEPRGRGNRGGCSRSGFQPAPARLERRLLSGSDGLALTGGAC